MLCTDSAASCLIQTLVNQRIFVGDWAGGWASSPRITMYYRWLLDYTGSSTP